MQLRTESSNPAGLMHWSSNLQLLGNFLQLLVLACQLLVNPSSTDAGFLYVHFIHLQLSLLLLDAMLPVLRAAQQSRGLWSGPQEQRKTFSTHEGNPYMQDKVRASVAK